MATTKDTITFVCVHNKGVDSYYETEGDYPQEMHTIEYTATVHFVEIPYSEAEKFYNDYLEMNADNPPYDEYSIKLAYDTDTKEVFSLERFR